MNETNDFQLGGKVITSCKNGFWWLDSILNATSGELNEDIGFFPANRIRLETPEDLGNVFDKHQAQKTCLLIVYL